MKAWITFALSLLAVASPGAQLINLNAPFFSQKPLNVTRLPSVFTSRDNPHEYFVLPLAFRVQLKNGKRFSRVLLLLGRQFSEAAPEYPGRGEAIFH